MESDNKQSSKGQLSIAVGAGFCVLAGFLLNKGFKIYNDYLIFPNPINWQMVLGFICAVVGAILFFRYSEWPGKNSDPWT